MNISAVMSHEAEDHPPVFSSHHPLVLVSSSGLKRGLGSLCSLIDRAQRQAGRRGRHPAVNREGGWHVDMNEKWMRQRGNDELRTVESEWEKATSRGLKNPWITHQPLSFRPVSDLRPSESLSIRLERRHLLLIWFQWSDWPMLLHL